MENKLKVLVIGHARHGKTTVSQILSSHFGLSFKDTSDAVCEIVIFDKLKDKFGYKTKEECFADKENKRKEWFDAIKEYNEMDKTRLAKIIMENYDIYCGLRDATQMYLCQKEGVFDVTIAVYNPRVREESKESMNFNIIDYSDYVIVNNGDISDLKEKTVFLFNKIIEKHETRRNEGTLRLGEGRLIL
jgi:dephospho-CoA kinase